MKEQDQQIAIAEWCGWKRSTDNVWIEPNVGRRLRLPNYLHDLNAIQEAVMRLDAKQKSEYICILRDMTSCDWDMINAIAAQRCEALLRTIGKWKERV